MNEERRQEKEISCPNCLNQKGVYVYAVLNGINVYDCPNCFKRFK
jgi:hypothetical protein